MSVSDDAPWRVLEIDEGANDEEIRQAYLRAVRRHPPDRSPAQFERIRDAYDQVRDARRRAMRILLANPCEAPLENLSAEMPETRRFVGHAPWLELMREKP